MKKGVFVLFFIFFTVACSNTERKFSVVGVSPVIVYNDSRDESCLALFFKTEFADSVRSVSVFHKQSDLEWRVFDVVSYDNCLFYVCLLPDLLGRFPFGDFDIVIENDKSETVCTSFEVNETSSTFEKYSACFDESNMLVLLGKTNDVDKNIAGTMSVKNFYVSEDKKAVRLD